MLARAADYLKKSGARLFCDYHSMAYWDSRYAAAEDKHPFDWYGDQSVTIPFLLHCGIKDAHRVLIPGCGNSLLSIAISNQFTCNVTSCKVLSGHLMI